MELIKQTKKKVIKMINDRIKNMLYFTAISSEQKFKCELVNKKLAILFFFFDNSKQKEYVISCCV